MCLPHKNGDLSSDSQNSCKKSGVAALDCNPGAERQRKADPLSPLVRHNLDKS